MLYKHKHHTAVARAGRIYTGMAVEAVDNDLLYVPRDDNKACYAPRVPRSKVASSFKTARGSTAYIGGVAKKQGPATTQ